MRAARWALSACAVAWAIALIVVPDALRPVGAAICHQRPERSFFVSGTQLPVCARCTGLYVGAAFAAPLALTIAAGIASARARRILALAALPTAVTWTLEVTGVAGFGNVARFIAALPLGFAAAALVLSVLRD